MPHGTAYGVPGQQQVGSVNYKIDNVFFIQ